MKFRLGLLAFLILGSPSWSDEPKRVVVVSIDSMRPEFYQDPRWECPTLRRLAHQGAAATRMISVFPSVTYVNHTSMVTGVRPNRHGIFSNYQFSQEVGPLPGWCFDSHLIQAPALWDLVHQAHLTCTSFSWPVSLGASVDWNVPEIFHLDGVDNETTAQLISKNTTPGMLAEIHAALPGPFPTNFPEWDQWLPDAFSVVWNQHKPSLALLHLVNVDWNQHRFGPESPETHHAIKVVDGVIARLLTKIDPATTTLLIVGDHGFQPVTQIVSLNRLFADKGWITVEDGKVRSFKVIAHSNGGSAAIYCKDPELEGEVLQLLQAQSQDRYTLVRRDRLDRLETFAGALCAVSARPGFGFRSDVAKPFLEPAPRPQGQHGQLPQLVPTGLIAWGRGIQSGRDLGEISILQVAPTVLDLLGLPAQDMEGQALKLQVSARSKPAGN